MNIKQQILNREGKHSVIHYFLFYNGSNYVYVTSFYYWNNGRYPPSGNWVLCGMGNMGSYVYLIVEAV